MTVSTPKYNYRFDNMDKWLPKVPWFLFRFSIAYAFSLGLLISMMAIANKITGGICQK